MPHDPKPRPPVDEDESLLQEASSELARAIWQTVLLSRDDAKGARTAWQGHAAQARGSDPQAGASGARTMIVALLSR